MAASATPARVRRAKTSSKLPGNDPRGRSAAPAATARKIGKRAAPDYVQVGVYLPRTLHNEAKVRLIYESQGAGDARDFSQLVGDLLSAYIAAQAKGRA